MTPPREGDDTEATATAMTEPVYEEVLDPVKRVLNTHQCIPLDDFERLCLCTEKFLTPDDYRTHVAALIYAALSLPGPIPNVAVP